MEKFKEIINEKITEFKNDIINMITKDEFKEKIQEKFNNLNQTSILLLIFMVNKNNMKNQIEEFLLKYEIENNTDNFFKIEQWYNYFLEVKSIFL